MKTTTFTCDVCKATGGSLDCIRPIDPSWIQIAMSPFSVDKQPEKVPSVHRDVCSTACAVKLLKGWQARLEELRREATK